MEFTQEQVFEAMGVKQPEQAGEKEPEVTEPAPSTPQAQEDVTAQPEEAAETGEKEEETAEPPQGSDKPEAQSPEQNREFAARRRRAEQQAAIDEALSAEREKHNREMEDFFAGAGLVNTLTGEPIKSMEDFTAWRESFEQAKIDKELKAGKMTRETLDAVISKNPVMQQAKQIIEDSRKAQESERMEQARKAAEAEIAEIHKLDPSINSMEDLMAMPNAQQYYEYVRKGNSLIDAYYLANREKLLSRSTQAAQQQALSNARSKEHLGTAAGRGAGAVSVPAEDMALFRELMPKATKSEIEAYYNKYKQK